MPDANRDGGRGGGGGGFRYVFFPLTAGFGKKVLDFVAIPGVVLRVSGGWNFRILRAAMSLGQSPLAGHVKRGRLEWVDFAVAASKVWRA